MTVVALVKVGPAPCRWMGSKSHKDISGIDFLVDSRGRRKAVLIDLEKHGPLWEDLYDAYVAQQRRNEPRESLAAVKKLLQSPARRRTVR